MKPNLKFSIPLAALGAVLAFNNPSVEDFKVEVKDYVYDNAEFKSGLAELEGAGLRNISGAIGGFVVDYGMDITQTNYVLFSVFHVRINPLISDYASVDREICYVGFLKSYYIKC